MFSQIIPFLLHKILINRKSQSPTVFYLLILGDVLLLSPLLTCGSSRLRLLESEDLDITDVSSSLIIEQVFPPREPVGPPDGRQKDARLLLRTA